MPHLEVPSAAARRGRGKPGTFGVAAWLLAAGLLVLGSGAGAAWMFGARAHDRVAGSEVQDRLSAFGRVEPLRLPAVAAEQIEQAIASMQLPPAQQAQLRELTRPVPKVAAAGVRLVELTVWDTHSQDGDVVALVSAGYRREIVLTNAPQTVVLPIDGAARMRLIGVHDGGGGITLGVRGADEQVLMPIMSEGQTLTLPLAR